MNRLVHGFIRQLSTDLNGLRYTIDPTIEARRFSTRSNEGMLYGVRVSLFHDDAYAEWAVLDAYQRLLFTRLSGNAQKYFSLVHGGKQELREAAINFAGVINADIDGDFPDSIEITSYEPIDQQNPHSTFVEDVSRYATALIKVAQKPIHILPTPISTPSLTPPVTPISPTPHTPSSVPTSYVPRPLHQDPHSRLMAYSILMNPAYRKAWELWKRYDRDWKEIPIEELEAIGLTRRITGGRDKFVDIQKKDSTSKS